MGSPAILVAAFVLAGAFPPPVDPVPGVLALERFDPARVLLEEEACRDERPQRREPDAEQSASDLVQRAEHAHTFDRPFELDATQVARILAWCEEHPDNLGQTVPVLPRDATTRAAVSRQLERYRALHAATRHHLDYFKTREKEVVDWLREPAIIPAPPPAQVARDVVALVRVAEDRGQTRRERVEAISKIMELEPDAHDAWYLARYADQSLLPPMDDYGQIDPLMQPVLARPDRWVPRIIELLEHPRKTQHTLASACLALFNSKRFRADAMTALLPWLDDPKWSAAPNIWRIRLIQACDVTEMRAAVPGLLRVIERERGFELADAAGALVVHGIHAATPVLKRGFERECDRYHESTLFVRIAQLNGWSFAELQEGLNAFAAAFAKGALKRGDPHFDATADFKKPPCPTTPERVGRQVDHWLASDGLCVDELEVHRENLVSAALATGVPALRGIVLEWPSRYADAYLMARLASGASTPEEIAAILHRRMRLVAHCGPALSRLANGRGWQAGVAAAVLSARDLELALAAGDDGAVAAALACARLLRRAVSRERVRALVPRAGVRAALSAYVTAQFGVGSWDALVGPGRVVLGRWFDPHDPIAARQLAGAERAVLASLDAPGGPDRVDALLEGYGSSVVVEHRGQEATLRVIGPGARALVRPLDAAEIAAVRALVPDFTSEYDQPCIAGTQHGGCSDSEYLSVDRGGGRRQRMSTLGIHRRSPHGTPGARAADALFRGLRERGRYRVEYPAGIQVLAGAAEPAPAEESWDAMLPRTVWCGFGGVRALIADREGHAGAWARVQHGRFEDGAAEPADCPVFAGLGLEDALPVPGDAAWSFDQVEVPDYGHARRLLRDRAVQFQLPPFARRVCGDPAIGVWIWDSYDHKARGPRVVVRSPGKADLAVTVPDRGALEPIGWQPRRESAVLACLTVPEFVGGTPRGIMLGHVPDSTTKYFEVSRNGSVSQVSGDMRPLVHVTFRDLQPARGGGQWAALPDEAGTVVGRYDRDGYRFKPVMRCAGVHFESMAMWVDEPGGRVLAAHGAEVIAIPLLRER